MGSAITELGSGSRFESIEELSPRFEIAHYTVLQLGEDLKTIGSAYQDPMGFINHHIQNLFKKTKPFIKNTFSSSFKSSLHFTGNFLISGIQKITPYIASAFKTSKLALQLMLSDIFEAFISPLSKSENKPLLVNTAIATTMFFISIFTHKLAIKHLKEDPDQSLSITYGALTGIFASYIMDQNIFIGTLTGASIGIITDTAVSYISRGELATLLKKLYTKYEIKEKAKAIQELTSKVFPYIINTLGTAVVYSYISPIITKAMDAEIPSKKIHVIKMVAASSILFGMAKSYFIPLSKSLLIHIKIGAKSAKETGLIASWAPRILTILLATSLLSPQNQ
jgi:hypothetical protein